MEASYLACVQVVVYIGGILVLLAGLGAMTVAMLLLDGGAGRRLMRSLLAPVIACQNWISVAACAEAAKPEIATTAKARRRPVVERSMGSLLW